ncbi:MAG: FecR domain-containing protein [Dysgonamonadaceae bacterium]|nr:FecR domain-containing protein [Dysgonamonadaceae bacterium]
MRYFNLSSPKLSLFPKMWEFENEFSMNDKKELETEFQPEELIGLWGDEPQELDPERKERLWNKIRHFNAAFAATRKRRQWIYLLSGAAACVALLLLGGLFYYFHHSAGSDQQEYRFSEVTSYTDAEKPVLILSNGERIELLKEASQIAVLANENAIQIDQNNIVKTDVTTSDTKMNEVLIPHGKRSQLVLEDGSKVWLNAGSRFAFPTAFTGKQRVVHLDGEAYFEVAKNEHKPFVVTTGSVTVEVLGTRFNVLAYHDDHYSETVLLEGGIAIREKHQPASNRIVMNVGQKATYDESQHALDLTFDPSPEMHIMWVQGWYQFANENSEHVFKKLERYYNVKFRYDKQTISGLLPISGKLDLKESLDEVLKMLSKVAKFQYRTTGNNEITILQP